MGTLLNIKDCRVTEMTNDELTLSGTDKLTGRRVIYRFKKIQFERWMDGIPLKFAIPSITEEQKNFLTKGTIK